MNRIVLIGNGFDLAHGLNTSYKHFICWYLNQWGSRLLHGLGKECKKQVFDQQFSEKLVSADFGKQLLHILIDKAVMRQRAAASLLGA